MAFRNQKRRWHCLPGVPPTEMDKTIMYWENKGKEVPTRDLIKTPEQIEGIRRAGVVNTGVLDAVAAVSTRLCVMVCPKKKMCSRRVISSMWTLPPFLTVITLMPVVCSSSERHRQKKNNWYVWPGNVSKSVWRPPNPIRLWAISVMR